jgi:hypothetical protein
MNWLLASMTKFEDQHPLPREPDGLVVKILWGVVVMIMWILDRVIQTKGNPK